MTRDDEKRKFPRASEDILVELSLRKGKREFSATVHTTDISLSGVFFASEFFLKPGTELDLEFNMPGDDRPVRVHGVIVREVRVDERSKRARDKTVSGFGMRFTEYFADAKTILATAFLAQKLEGFVSEYLRRRTKRLKTESEQVRDVLVAWEVSRMDLGMGERELLLGRTT